MVVGIVGALAWVSCRKTSPCIYNRVIYLERDCLIDKVTEWNYRIRHGKI